MSEPSSERTIAERITFVLSLVILIVVFGVAGWVSITSNKDSPLIVVETRLEETRQSGARFYVPITITNEGGLTAQDVVVTGELDTGEGQPESGEVTITFLSGGESEEAELVFTADPNEGDLTVGPTSFVYP